MIEYREARLADAVDIAGRLRRADAVEIQFATGLPARSAVYQSFAASRRVWVATVNGRPECIFGIAEVNPVVGCPWMVGTDEVLRHQRELLRAGRSIVEDMNAAYPLLENFVHADNTPSIRWLGRLGFRFKEPIPFGPQKQPFIPFFRYPNV
jgi:hypothetical protein